MKIDITKRAELNDLLNKLKEDTRPVWGAMKAQNMIEHMSIIVQHTNGKKTITQRVSDEEAKNNKQVIIYTDMEIPQGLKSPLLSEEPEPFIFLNLKLAKNDLNKQLDDFENYFKNNPSATFVQPRFGPLNHSEWIILHNKHFTHHFKQFGLL